MRKTCYEKGALKKQSWFGQRKEQDIAGKHKIPAKAKHKNTKIVLFLINVNFMILLMFTSPCIKCLWKMTYWSLALCLLIKCVLYVYIFLYNSTHIPISLIHRITKINGSQIILTGFVVWIRMIKITVSLLKWGFVL